MQQRTVWVLSAAVLLAACSPTVAENSSSATRDETSLPVRSRVTCPAQDFPGFLKAFAADIELQRAFVRYPYAAAIYDPQALEADPKVMRLNADQINFPVILSDREMAEHGVSARVEQKAKDWYEVSTQSQGSGAYTMTFNFHYTNGCWLLTDSVDAST